MDKKVQSPKAVFDALISNKISLLEDIKDILSTRSTMTVFRKLSDLGYLTSYSHRGKYYTLRSIPEFNQFGLWSFNSVWFSKYGNLIETAKEFIDNSIAGFSANELNQILHVEVKHVLLKLFQINRIYREKISGVYVYFILDATKRKVQIAMRKDCALSLSDDIKAAIILFFSLLNEKQRRLYAGLEALKLGYGGDKKIAQLLGLDPHTVAKGRNELLDNELEGQRLRKKGSGRNLTEKKLLKSLKK